MKLTHLTDYLRRNASMTGQKPAVVFENQTVSWAELWSRVEQASGYMSQRLGNEKQEPAALLLPNSIDFIVSYLAILHSGHMALPLDPAYKFLELDAIIEQIPSKLLISDQVYARQFSPNHRKKVVMVDDILDSRDKPLEPLRLPADQQIASLTFTSGTTGKPKAVPNTHSNHIWNIRTCSEVWDWTPADTLLVAVPLSHMLGVVMGLSGALYHGNTIYLHSWFDETEVLKTLSSGKISFFSHAASAYVKLMQTKGNYDLSKVRLCVSGAASLPPSVWHEFKNRFGVEIVETYGTSETGRIAGNRLNERVQGSPGKALPGVDLRLSGDGEVEVKSPGVFPGYYHNPQATAANRTADGYWRTGDIAEVRDDYVYLKGRLQERIRRFGYTISPRDVEWAMHQHPKVKDIYVMGRQRANEPDDELVYFIVTDLSETEIRDYAKANLIFAWRPDKIVRLDHDLPRTRSGKPSIGLLREMVTNA
ncbi:MAG TPA: class I adenylate-forming enzyme family protein [Candidatus Saccharimonadales bacterium]|nr:class I adenylate-forming enzyme family protein [Candidatus Saccharimonadales bacterium]